MELTTTQRNAAAAVIKESKDHGLTWDDAISAVAKSKRVSRAKVEQAFRLYCDTMKKEAATPAPEAAPVVETKKAPRLADSMLIKETPADLVHSVECLISVIVASAEDSDPDVFYTTPQGNIIYGATYYPATRDLAAHVAYRVRLSNGKTRPRSCSPETFLEIATANK